MAIFATMSSIKDEFAKLIRDSLPPSLDDITIVKNGTYTSYFFVMGVNKNRSSNLPKWDVHDYMMSLSEEELSELTGIWVRTISPARGNMKCPKIHVREICVDELFFDLLDDPFFTMQVYEKTLSPFLQDEQPWLEPRATKNQVIRWYRAHAVLIEDGMDAPDYLTAAGKSLQHILSSGEDIGSFLKQKIKMLNAYGFFHGGALLDTEPAREID